MQKIVPIWHVLLLVLLLCGNSCKDDKKQEPYFNLETTEGNQVLSTISAGYDGMTQSFVVKSNGSWKITLSGGITSWLSVYPDYGTQDGTFNLKVEANSTSLQRKAQLSCTIDGREINTFSIEQSAFQSTISITPDTPVMLPANGGEAVFTVETNAGEWEYTVAGNSGWITEKSRNNTNLTFEATSNISTNGRTVMVTFSLPSAPGVIKQVQISQEGLNISPAADLLDVVFKMDGTAEDISPFHHNIQTIPGSNLTTLFSNIYKRHLSRFSHAPGGSVSTGYYKFDYSDNQAVKDALADGHTLEAMFMLDIDGPLPNAEIKMLSSHEGGGTGMMIGNTSRNNSIIFLPHVGSSGYVWTSSGVRPERGKYYHVVGVWNKQEGKSYIYIDGELKSSVNTSGNFNFPVINWFGIGADAGNPAQSGWKGDVVIARIYDRPLATRDVEKLWKEVENLVPDPDEIQISGVSLPSKRVLLNSIYSIKGMGFVSGDRITVVPVSGAGAEYSCDGTVNESAINITIPPNFVTGKYRFFVVRGAQRLDLGFATLTVVNEFSGTVNVIAHRGYWTAGKPQNSVAALAEAQKLGIYGAEFDVWITTDGKIVLNHDATLSNGTRIETSTYAQIKDFTLSNGEKLPTLEDYLEQGKKDPSTKLILEIKTHSFSTGGVANNDRVAAATVNLVQAENMTDQVEYIAFSLDVCRKILELQPNATVAYLNGDVAPQALHNMGIKGIDYNISVLRGRPNWITEAQNLGMTVNVWTVNSANDIQDMIDYGVDYITTDYPELVMELITVD
jgi:glycerophosphoryl diester phosphodiesterase